MQAILATLGYVLSPDGSRVLMIRRDTRPDDLHFGYYNGLGGKLEPGEDVVACMRREIREEAGLECEALELAGTISWPGFGRNGENWFGFLFRITRWSGTPYETCPEGTLIWTDLSDILAARVPMWPTDQNFLPLVFAPHPQVFHASQPFHQGAPAPWTHSLTEAPPTPDTEKECLSPQE
ncbi:8-oxo-dGTP diphosphatase [Micromonospora sp. NBC_01699]|uniref:NUDIX hydrolase n=1 Tax=Micromonospora sp. NBC_01699 TaxID=2975984 RepID=UPI002E28C16F|nr:8-oxo-dGTP diphosphatase [Micromonospora sp. NBC_01699]